MDAVGIQVHRKRRGDLLDVLKSHLTTATKKPRFEPRRIVKLAMPNSLPFSSNIPPPLLPGLIGAVV